MSAQGCARTRMMAADNNHKSNNDDSNDKGHLLRDNTILFCSL
jgi:hypothetical protein